jgi:tetratricopeptide (TPR) repeat protein
MRKEPTIQQLFSQFEINLYETSLKDNPKNLEALVALGHAYTKVGQNEKALGIDKQIVNLLPEDPTARYNLACDYSLLNMNDDALNALELAFLLGYHDFEHLEKDMDLNNLRQDQRYHELLNRVKTKLSIN